MGALVPFAYDDALVRVVEIAGAPWWIAGDVAKVLGFKHTPHMLRLLDDDEKGVRNVDTLGGRQDLAIISESGLYHAIFSSRQSSAARFRKWVTSEVLPAIRRYGFYRAVDPRTAEMQELRERPISEKQEAHRDRRIEVVTFVEQLQAQGVPKSRAVAEANEKFGRGVSTIYGDFAGVRMVLGEDRPVALTPQWWGGGRQADIHPEAWERFCAFASRSGATVSGAYRQARAMANARGWGDFPCEATFRRRLRAIQALSTISIEGPAQ